MGEIKKFEKVSDLMNLCNALEEKLTKKEEAAERLVGAVVNKVATEDKKKIKREQMIKDILVKHKKALEKLS